MKRFKPDDLVKIEGEPEEGRVIIASNDRTVTVSFRRKLRETLAPAKTVPIGKVTLIEPNPMWPLAERTEYPA